MIIMKVWDKVENIMRGFDLLGMSKKQHVALISPLCKEWIEYDIAILVFFPKQAANFFSVPTYTFF